MSQLMRDAYEKAGALKYYFDETVPVDLWRGQKKSDKKDGGFPLQPVTLRFEIVTPQGKRWREADVAVFERNGEKWIKGCRTIRHGGQHWGVSLWTQQPAFAAKGGWVNLKVPKGTPIPKALAVTQDDDYSDRSNHYTIAPKDDMPLDLYVQWLKEMATHIVEW